MQERGEQLLASRQAPVCLYKQSFFVPSIATLYSCSIHAKNNGSFVFMMDPAEQRRILRDLKDWKSLVRLEATTTTLLLQLFLFLLLLLLLFLTSTTRYAWRSPQGTSKRPPHCGKRSHHCAVALWFLFVCLSICDLPFSTSFSVGPLGGRRAVPFQGRRLPGGGAVQVQGLTSPSSSERALRY